LTAVEIVPISPALIEDYRRAVDAVARERRYLAILEAFPMERTRDFVLRLLAAGDPIHVALANGAVVGWCDIQRHPFPTHAHRGMLGIGVLAEYRCRGVGLGLIQQTLDAGFANGLVRIELSVRADTLHAMRLYEKVGFAVEGVLRDAVFVDGEYHDAIAMALVDKARSRQ
jgi:RimJ/RimL family protein N-acetyltransferase